MLSVKGKQEHKSFILHEPIDIPSQISVLTGKNGSGKTRFLESCEKGLTEVCLDKQILGSTDIKLVPYGLITPSFSSGYNHTQFNSKIAATLAFYDRVKKDFDMPFQLNIAQAHNRGRNEQLDYESLYRLCKSISTKVNKPASQLLHEDISFYFEEPEQNVLGVQNISRICNEYLKKKRNNKYNKWRREVEGENVTYLSEAQFVDTFGKKPWTVINEILHNTFEGKFGFNIPDEDSQSYTYQAQLTQIDDNIPISVDALSSGEKTLLWLALTLFNSQYYDPDMIKSPKLLLIDEPDAFLHPKMVVKMYQVLESFNRNFGSSVIITTHSPTTIALAKTESTYLVANNTIRVIDKDSAIAELLDGITQIAISPDNRRQVFVESQYDAEVYQNIYLKLAHRSELIHTSISLTFVSAGPKMPQQHIKDKVKQILSISDDKKIDIFIEAINGSGNCSQVIGQVQALIEKGNKSVRGIIDRDKNNKSCQNIAVLGEGQAYSIENFVLDPICIMLLLHFEHSNIFTITSYCGEDVHFTAWLQRPDLLQNSLDRFISNVLKRENKRDSDMVYSCGLSLKTDSDYLDKQGHELENIVRDTYPQLKKYSKEGELKKCIVEKAMIILTDGKFIPKAFESAFSRVQH